MIKPLRTQNIRRLVMLSILLSQALVLSIIESRIPPIYPQVPGVKLGLANIITILTIVTFGFKEALGVVLLRNVMTAVFAGNLTIFLFSAAGGILSTIVMSLLYFKASRLFSITGISVVGSLMHNVGQISLAAFLMKDLMVISYLPVLLLSGIVMGLFVGLCSNYLIKAAKRAKIINE